MHISWQKLAMHILGDVVVVDGWMDGWHLERLFEGIPSMVICRVGGTIVLVCTFHGKSWRCIYLVM